MRWCWCCVLVLLVGCDSSRSVAPGDAGPDAPSADQSYMPDWGHPDRALPDLRVPDLPRPRDTAVMDATAPDADGCVCPGGQVWLIGPCVPTTKLSTCAPTCDPGVPGSCPSGQQCDQWAAAPCCMCSAAVPACVASPSTGPISGPLRSMPTSGTAGQQVTITVQGAPFYIGALFYYIRLGSEQKMDMTGGKCSIKASFTPPSPGIYAVEVSQYGGGTPWVLAGFYTASGGSLPMPTVQPGYPCATNPAPGDPACAQGDGYGCGCVGGRCSCSKSGP